MCKIVDFVYERGLYPPIPMAVQKYDTYSIVSDSDYGDSLVASNAHEHSQYIVNNNDILIEALIYGQLLAAENQDFLNNYYFEDVTNYSHECYSKTLIPFLNKYGIPDFEEISQYDNGTQRINDSHVLGKLSYVFLRSFADLCLYTKAKYGYDMFENSLTRTITPDQCLREFSLTLGTYYLKFNGSRLEQTRPPLELGEILDILLAETLLNDDIERMPFTCQNCGKPSSRINPRQIYCNSCSRNRAQISRRKKRTEGK